MIQCAGLGHSATAFESTAVSAPFLSVTGGSAPAAVDSCFTHRPFPDDDATDSAEYTEGEVEQLPNSHRKLILLELELNSSAGDFRLPLLRKYETCMTKCRGGAHG